MIRLLLNIGLFIKRLLWKPVWHFVYFFLKKPKRLWYVALLFAGLALFAAYGPEPTPEMVMTEKQAAELLEPDYKKVQLPQINGTVSNGNSRFAKRLGYQLPPQEREVYSRHFDFAIRTVPQGDMYKWKQHDAFFGSLKVAALFKAKNGIYCRNFEEVLAYQTSAQRFVGTACQRKSGGWCKLNRSSAHTCEIGSASTWDIWWQQLF